MILIRIRIMSNKFFNTLSSIGLHRPRPIIQLKHYFDNKADYKLTLVAFTDAGFCREVELFCSVNSINIKKRGYLNGIAYCLLES
jgi:hypothetical protein